MYCPKFDRRDKAWHYNYIRNHVIIYIVLQQIILKEKIVVKENSKINMAQNAGFNPSSEVAMKRNDRQLVSTEGILLNDVSFSTLSAAASFVTGRIANGYMVWKTEDNKYVRFTLKLDEKNE